MAGARWQFPAEARSVPQVREVVARYAGEHCVPEPPLEDLKLAVTEAVTNAVVHAYRATDEAGFVTIAIEVREHDRVTVTVADDGMGMRPRIDSPGLGLGLAMINSLATSAEVRTPAKGSGTEVCMTFSLAG